MSSLPSTPLEGEVLRDAALALLRTRRAALVRACERAALTIALDLGEVDADAVRGMVAIPDGINPKLVGAAFNTLAVAGILRRVGYRASTRPIAHRRPLSLWRLADPAAARTWLVAHPPIETE